MGKRSDQRKFRRRRRWAGFFLLLSLGLIVFSARLLLGMVSPDAQQTASSAVEKIGVERVKSTEVADAPEAVNKDQAAMLSVEEEDSKTAGEKQAVDERAARKADEKLAAENKAEEQAQKPDDPKQAAVPDPPTDDLWMSIPALGLYNNYVTDTYDFSAMDYGAIKLADSAFPWQDHANTYISAHRLGWPGTASHHQFYNLPLLKNGDVIYLGDVNGTTYTYKVSGVKEVAANDTSVTAPQPGRNMISLQTCIENYGDYWTMGPNWYVRYVVQADRVSVKAAE